MKNAVFHHPSFLRMFLLLCGFVCLRATGLLACETASVSISIFSAEETPSTLLCPGTQKTLQAYGSTGNDPASFLWSNGSTNSFIDINTAGTYSITVTNTTTGCTASTSITIVNDTEPPVARCRDFGNTVYIDGNTGYNENTINNGSTDNCGIVSMSLQRPPVSADCLYLGPNTVTLTVTDASGNSSSCTATVTYVESPAWLMICKPTDVVEVGANPIAVAYSEVLQIGDPCGVLGYTSNISAFTCDMVGTTVTHSITAIDQEYGGNEAPVCFTMVTVVDNTPPVAKCKSSNLNFIVDATGNLQLHAQSIDDGSFDNCSNIEARQLSQYNFDCDDVGGTFPVTLTVWDMSGNTNSCTTNITVNDIYDPIVEFVPNIGDFTLALGANGQATLGIDDVTVSITDNCSIASQTLSRTAFDCDDLGLQNVILTVADVNGNSVELGFLVNVVDETDPVAICKNATVVLDANGNGSVTTADINDGSTDNCGITSMSLDFTSFDCSSLGEHTVTLTLVDDSENEATCTATVTVETQPLVAQCNANVILQLDANGNGSVNAYSVNSGSQGGCGELSFNLSHTTFDCDNVGPNPVVLTVTDVNGVTSTCNSFIVVQDQVAPTAYCNEELTLNLDASGFATITPAMVDNGSTDACGIYQLQLNKTMFDCSEAGPHTVYLTATDVHGNNAVCASTVNVLDNIAPTAFCQNVRLELDANGTGSTTAAALNNGSFDNCGIASMTLSKTNFDCSNANGYNAVTLTMTDASGNESSCNAYVDVQDVTMPVPLCKNVTIALDPSTGTATLTPAQVDGGSSDACGLLHLIVYPNSYNCSNVGTTSPYTFIVSDTKGNTTSCTGTVTVEGYPINVSLPSNLTAYYGYIPGSCVTINSTVSGGTAPYSYLWNTGATTPSIEFCATSPNSPAPFTLTVTDANGCVSTGTATTSVHVEDVSCGSNNNKVLICHNCTNICVNISALPAHLAHGDQLGSCGAPNPCGSGLAISGNLEDEIEHAEHSQGGFMDEKLGALNLYPNPASGYVVLDLSAFEGRQSSIKLINLLGSTVMEHQLEAVPYGQIKLELNDVKDGVYWMYIEMEGKRSMVQKLVVTKP